MYLMSELGYRVPQCGIRLVSVFRCPPNTKTELLYFFSYYTMCAGYNSMESRCDIFCSNVNPVVSAVKKYYNL